MVRIAYFGTDGCPGHHVIPIQSGFNFLHNHNNGRMRSGHIVINGIGMFKQIMKSGT